MAQQQQQTMPSSIKFIFQINEVRQHPQVNDTLDTNGYWVPSLYPGYNILAPGRGATGTWWICNGTRIYSVNESVLPKGKTAYKTFSVFFTHGFGFRILQGDATDPHAGEVWHPLGFEHDDADGYSSYLTHVLQQPSLRCHRQDQAWVPMLLPNTLHGPAVTAPSQGALKGELPIFLALLALSMPHRNLPGMLPQLFSNGQWLTHTAAPGSGWTDKRGVVVTVYACPTLGAGARTEDIRNLEEGRTGKYYY